MMGDIAPRSNGGQKALIENSNTSNPVASSAGINAIVSGPSAKAYGPGSLALGVQSYASQYGSIALGSGANAGGDGTSTGASLVIGLNATDSFGIGCVVLGPGAKATSNYGVAIGRGATAGGNPSIVIATGNMNSGGITASSYQVVLWPQNNGQATESPSGAGSVIIGSGGSSSAKMTSGTATTAINWATGTNATPSNCILMNSGGYLGGNNISSSASSTIILTTGSSIDFTNIASNNIFLGNGWGSLADNPGKVVIQGNAGFGAGTSENAFVQFHSQTTDATATESFLNYSTNTKRLALPNNFTYAFKTTIVARQYGGASGTVGDTSMWTLTGVIKRIANAAATSIVGSVTQVVVAQDTAAAAWTVAHTADTTNGSLKLTVTGEASKSIRWHAKTEFLSLQ